MMNIINKRMRHKRNYTSFNAAIIRTLLISTALSAANPAFAQTVAPAETGELTDIVVTANRREENLQKVPIAISAFSGESLAQSGVTNITEIGTLVPGVVLATVVGYAQPYVRGVGTSATGPGFENPIATYIDGVYYAAQSGGLVSLDNIASIEIDKGPQGTLFGRNATGGAIQINTLDPTSQFSGKASIGYGNYDTVAGQFYVTGGLSSTLSANLAVGYSHQGDGYGTNLANGEDVDKTNSIALRGKLLWEPVSGTSVLIAADYDRTNGIPVLAPAPGTIPQFNPPVADDPRDVYGDPQPFLHSTQWGVAGTIKHDMGWASLKSITAYRSTVLDALFDSTLTAEPGTTFFIAGREPHKQFSQEVQLASTAGGPLSWLVGAYYFWERAGYLEPTTIGGESFALFGLPSGILQAPDRKTNAGALFGQGTYKTDSGTSLTVGLRYSIERRDARFIQTLPDFGISDVDFTEDKTFNNLSWRLAVSQDLSDDVMAYASYNRGFKSGTFNNADPSIYPLVIEPETLDAFEVGLKTALFDRHVKLNLAGFLYKYKNLQTVTYPSGSLVIINGGKATLYGLDADMEWAMTSDFNLTAGLSAMHTQYDSFPDAPISVPVGLPDGGTVYTTRPDGAKGNRLGKAPAFTGYVALNYAHDFEGVKAEANVTYSYNDGWYAEADNRLLQSGYSLLNASVGLTHPSESISIKFWGKNLLNKDYAATMASQTNGDYIQYAAPRTYGVTIGSKF